MAQLQPHDGLSSSKAETPRNQARIARQVGTLATTLLRSSLGNWGSLLRVSQRSESCHCPWCHRRTFEGLSCCGQLTHVDKGQCACSSLAIVITLLTTPPADRLCQCLLSATSTFCEQFQPCTLLESSDPCLQLPAWDSASPRRSEQDHPRQQ